MAFPKQFKTLIEINKDALRSNIGVFKKILGGKAKLMSVVKSNAYGHGITVFPKLADAFGVDGFCVDSVMEGKTLRLLGIKKPILVLGYTLPDLFSLAVRYDLVLTVSTLESLKKIARAKEKPRIHLKIETGMHRQGFSAKELKKDVIRATRQFSLPVEGVYTHFASAKDINYPTYTKKQFENFKIADDLLKKAGIHDLARHVAATGGTLVNKKYHLDWVRVGIGLYGLWPSKELEIQLGKEIMLKPVLSWRTIISEIKQLKKGEYSGYDLAYRAPKNQVIAVVPIGYWHGIPRSYSGGKVLIRGKEAPIIGRISMDIIVIDVSGVLCNVGDTVTLIGKNSGREISAFEVAQKTGTIHYELLTRLNPLIERIAV